MRRFVLLFVLASAGIWAGQAQQDWYYPPRGAEWATGQPADWDIDAAALQRAVTFAESNEYTGSRDLRQAILQGFQQEPYHQLLGPVKKRGGPAGMILKKGYLIASWGETRRVDMAFSVTKSFLSTVAGLARQKGLIGSLQEPVANYVWDGTFEGVHNAKINWTHLLQQNSDWSGDLWGQQDWADRPPREGGIDDWKNRTLLEPGTVMEYNDVRVNVLAYSLTQVWRQPLPAVLKAGIMDPIGASTTWRWHGYDHAWTVIDGMKMQSVTGGGHSGAGLFISAEDMARFGLLFLSRGRWNGTNLLEAAWIEEAVAPSAPNPNYGYMWWLNQPGARQWEGLPGNIYYAAGFGGNFIVVCPDQELVMVLRWLEPSQIGEFVGRVFQALR